MGTGMRRNKIIGILLAAFVFATTLAGCSNGNKEKPVEEATVTVLVQDQGSSPLGVQLNALLDKSKAYVEKENPGLTINVVRVPPAQYADQIETLKPDIYWVAPFELSLPQKAGKLYDLKPLTEQADVDITQYFPENLLEMTSVDGKLLGIPLAAYNMTVAYSKSWFKNAGLAEPQPNWTWEEFESDAIALQEVNGSDSKSVYGASIPLYPDFVESIVLSRGGSFLSPDGAQASGFLDGPKSVETMEWLKGLVRNGVLDPASGGDVSLIGINTGMGLSLSPIISNAAVSNSDIGIVPLPSGAEIVSAPYVTAFSINSASSHPEAALKYILALTMDDNEITRESLQIGMSISKKVFENGGSDLNPALAVDFQLLPYAHKRAAMQSRAWGEAMGLYANNFTLMMQTDLDELVPTLQQMARSIDATLADARMKDEQEAAEAATVTE